VLIKLCKKNKSIKEDTNIKMRKFKFSFKKGFIFRFKKIIGMITKYIKK
jgi:hypothetical protein